MKQFSLFILACVLSTSLLKGQMAGVNAYIKGTSVEIGVDGTYGYEGLDATVNPPLAGMHWRSGGTNYFGFVANPQLNAWLTYDGDFFSPGSPENGWGLEIGSGTGIVVNNNCSNGSFGVNDVPGSSNYSTDGSCLLVDYNGTVTTGGTNIGVHINYNLGQNDLYYTTTVSITNNTSATIPELYYHRNLDPDNNVSINGGDYTTLNTIVSQPGGPSGCNLAHVKATSTNPSSQPQSYLGLAAVGANFRVSWGGFSNRDASDLWAWTNATTYFPSIEQTVGASATNDCAISLSYKIANLAPGATETFKFVVILDDAAAANAIDNLLYFTYIGASGTPPSSCNPSPDSINTCGAPVPIQINGTIVNDYTWSWSPSTGLSGTTGPVVTANPGVSTLYTVTGTPISPCLAPLSMQVWVIVTPSAGANPFISYIPNQCTGYPPFNLTVDSLGGVWSGVGITNPTLGTFTPGSVAPGTYMITYTTPGGCNSIDTALVTVIGSNSATITQPPIICVGTPAFNLVAADSGGVWSGTGITNSASGTFNPSVTGTSLITYAFSGTCPLQDTVLVTVAPTFTYSVTQSSTNSCLMDPVQLTVSPSTAGTYTYDWSPGTSLSDSTISSPLATFITPGTHTYTVTVTNAFGCAQTSTFSVVAASAFSPVIAAIGDTTMCGSNPISLGATFVGASVPATCGPSTSGGCGGAAFVNVVGTGTTTNMTTDYPAPYGNWYTSVKQQYLYTAAELNAAGITGGKIDQLDFNVTAIAGISTYHFYSISMGCTNLTSFPSSPVAFETGLTNVFPPATYTIATGWNAHPFTTAFNWDGISNVIVEVCFNELNPGSNYTQNSSCTNTATTYFSSLVSLSDSQDQCSFPPGWVSAYMARPNIRLHYCSVIPNPANYTYTWTPGALGNVTDSTAQNTTATPPGTMDYYVTVTDIAGGCSDVDTVSVTVLPFTGINPFISYVPNQCVTNAPFNLTINTPGGVWTGSGITDDSLGTFDPGSLAAGTYTITYTSPGSCNGADTVQITVQAAANAAITNPSGVCEGTSPFNLVAASGGGVWSGTGITDSINGTFDPATAGVYSVIYTIPGLCPSADTTTVTVNSVSVPITGFSYPTSPVCIAGTDPTPSPVPSFTTGGSYTSTPGLVINSSTGVPDLSASTAGTYTITYTVAATLCGPSGSSTATLTITPLSTPITSFSYITPVCPGDSMQLPTTAPGFLTGGVYYSLTSGLTVDSLTGAITVTSSVPGVYTVNYTTPVDPVACIAAATGTSVFTINPLPNIDVSADQLIYFGEAATIHAVGGTTYSWSPADFTCVSANCDTITVAPGETTDYCVTVTENGCIDSACVRVQIVVPCISNRDMTVPNAFTPNGDGINDELCLNGWTDCVKSFNIVIYDRWGEKVYESSNSNFCWDGTYRGRQLDPAVFVYFIKASYDTEGATIQDAKKVIQLTKTGNISLVR